METFRVKYEPVNTKTTASGKHIIYKTRKQNRNRDHAKQDVDTVKTQDLLNQKTVKDIKNNRR